MYSEHDCGVCYQTYNAGRRCPLELRCGHGFCECCLRALLAGEGRPVAGRSINCPLCRHTTFLSGDGNVKAELKVNEGILEQLMAAGVLNSEEEEPEEEREVSQTTAGESYPSAGGRNRKFRRCLRKVWRVIIGKTSQRRDGCMTTEELKSIAMMQSFF